MTEQKIGRSPASIIIREQVLPLLQELQEAASELQGAIRDIRVRLSQLEIEVYTKDVSDVV